MHYGKAMSLARSLDSPERLLALSLPLIATANMLGFWRDSHAHILSALKLLPRGGAQSWSDAASIGATLTRMDLQSMTFSDSASPYPFDTRFALSDPREGELQPGGQRQTYSQASSMLFVLIRQIIFHTQAVEDHAISRITFMKAHARLETNLALLEQQMADLEARPTKEKHECASISVRIYHTWLRLMMRIPPFSPQTANDENLAYFERIVVLCKVFLDRQSPVQDLQLSLEPALIVPLFETAKRCRHPRLRRTALNLLKGMNRQEGMWRSDGAASAVEILIAKEESIAMDELADLLATSHISDHLEEAALAVPWSAWSSSEFELPTTYTWEGVAKVPEEERVLEMLVLSRFDDQKIDLRLLMCSGDERKAFGDTKEYVIDYTRR
ncbi:Uu.00g105320.m01.CDS01 [Anthostomella pinea]|uniref:Uu.00g105320.m01.CDS01 n=1 Tax=Anthostomella pinea TaxID=933095 RepID=A0AAI8VDZ8_9PEZI|nr:Uu.00g105320.m01.CDS01 [Anthostomella pinea]